jgi:hypothetical protein
MSLFPAFINARKRKDDSAPQTEAVSDSHAGDSHAADSDDNVFNLLPPEASEQAAYEPKPQGRNRHPVDMTDLSRLSIDRDGRLYWDGKPVEVHRRLMLSRAQIVGAGFIAAFVVIGALGAALQGSVAARDWACRLGWATGACGPPAAPRHAFDIPA